MDVSREVGLLEEVLQASFREVPDVAPKTQKAIVGRYRRRAGLNLAGARAKATELLGFESDALYDPNIDTIFLATGLDPEVREYRLLHELAHAYEEHVSPPRRTDTIEQAIVDRAISEGIADYLAIRAQMHRAQNEEKRPERTFAHRQEWRRIKPREEGDRHILIPTSIHEFGGAREIVQLGRALEEAEQAQQRPITDGSLAINPYIMGHYLVRSAAESQPDTSLGVVVLSLLAQPPMSFAAMEQHVVAATEKSMRSAVTMLKLARKLYTRQSMDAALMAVDRAAKYDAGNPLVHYERGRILHELAKKGKGRYTPAARALVTSTHYAHIPPVNKEWAALRAAQCYQTLMRSRRLGDDAVARKRKLAVQYARVADRTHRDRKGEAFAPAQEIIRALT